MASPTANTDAEVRPGEHQWRHREGLQRILPADHGGGVGPVHVSFGSDC